MKRPLYLRIVQAVEEQDPWFKQRRNAAGKLGLSSLQKVTAAFRMLAFDAPADFLDECLRLGESTIIESMRRFVAAIIHRFGDKYLRAPNEEDIARLLHINEQRGFPGILGSIDCMHWRWKNCPTAWSGSFTGHAHAPIIILEVVASQVLWFWHACLLWHAGDFERHQCSAPFASFRQTCRWRDPQGKLLHKWPPLHNG